MEELLLGILSGAIYDAVKGSVKITTEYLKTKLRNWLLSDRDIEQIEKFACSIPEMYTISKGMIEEYIRLNKDIMKILSEEGEKNESINQSIVNYNGIAVQNRDGNVTINEYKDREEPRDTQCKNLSLLQNHSRFQSVPIVKSFCSTRDECIIEETRYTVFADIVIPSYVKEKEGCHFSMVLFSYIPSENWSHYVDEKYKLEFELETSESIKHVQLQIKDKLQQQFIDKKIEKGMFSHSLAEMAKRDSWKDVREICFTIFADDGYITGEKGFIRIKNPQLVK